MSLQLGRRREVEEENVRLRAMLELQVEEAKCLQRILKRRRKIQMMEDMLGMKRQRFEKSLMTPKEFDEMPCPGQNRKAYRNVVSGIFYERQEKTEIPFDDQQTQEAVWKVLLDHGIGSVKRLKGLSSMVDFRNKQSNESSDTITSSYFAATPRINGVSGAQVRKVVRKYTEDNKVVFIYKVVVEPRGKCTTTLLGYQLHSVLRIVMRQRPTPRMDPSITAKFRQPEQLDIDIAMWDKLILGVASEVENMLIDDTLELKATPRKSLEVAV
ncbi:hypothetical protein P3T76_010515 [Phytophthora citrophthora]|uniref:Uncharacterized protein n=1 Tax=Phytophthora citrophthora TaxID=4793 RepID=A0AAD9GCK2_9STRA|nr:hypothetical protein P3T76_010515 [Phytophthora citrophthora]